jgi:Rod binding domain-containing protein
MAIDPPSDVILEVAKAADPARAAAATQRLNALGGAAEVEDFSQTLAATAPAPAPAPASDAATPAGLADARTRLADADAATPAGLADARTRLADADAAADAKAAKARTDFEAVMLNSFVSEMLPKDSSTVFGQGLAGDMWKSMLADQISRQVAKSGSLGLARRLFGGESPLSASASLERAGRLETDAHDVAQMSANALSLPSGAEHFDGAFLFPGRRRS